MNKLKPNNISKLSISKNLFLKAWMQFTQPFHHLTQREQEVAVAYLEKWFELLQKIPEDDNLRLQFLVSESTNKEIKEKCNLKDQHFQVIKTHLKANKFIIDGNRINPRLIPNLNSDNSNLFQFLLIFELKDE